MSESVFIIAEAGVNHDGDLDKAFALIDVAADAGADAVKFQTFSAERLVTRGAAKAAYQVAATGTNESQFDMLRRLELSLVQHHALLERCTKRGIRFLSTPFDIESLHFLTSELRVGIIKLGSGEVTNGPLLLSAARTGRRIILSTGMATPDEIERALAVLAFGYIGSTAAPSSVEFVAAYAHAQRERLLQEKVVLLHCTTEYPAPFDEVNLNAMETMRRDFKVPVGYSDHTPGIAVSIAAAAKGATVIEKHFTLDRNAVGPDHAASLEPSELADMIRAIRQTELAQGDGVKRVTASERRNVSIARKVIVAAQAIGMGELLTEQNLTVKRAGSGISPMRWWETIGTRASRAYAPDEPIGAA